MKILFWTEQFWPYIGGVEVLTLQLARALHKRGHGVSVITSHGSLDLPNQACHQGISVHRFPILKALQAKDAMEILEIHKKISKLKRRLKVDVIQVNLSDPGVFFHLQTQKAWPAPTVLSFQVAPHHKDAGPDTLLGRAIERAAWITFPSKAAMTQVQQLGQAMGKRSSVILNGVTPSTIRPKPLDWKPPQLLCIARLVEEKGLQDVIHALTLLPERFSRTRLRIAGDGPARKSLENLVRELKLEARVDFCGWVQPETTADKINQASLVVIPSRYFETFGLVAVESALMNRPVLASRIGGLSEVILDGFTGRLFSPGNIKELSSVLTEMLSDPSGCSEMGMAAGRRARSEFTMERYAFEHEALYRRLCRQSETIPVA